jgi:gp16 family phage-associated protein
MLTPEVVKDTFSEHGISIRDWAARNGFSQDLVYAVLNRRNQATRGQSYRIAVALGLRDRPEMEEVPAQLRACIESMSNGSNTAT